MKALSHIRYAGFALFAAINISMSVSITAHAEVFALLMGASGYPSLRSDLRLNGPANDVRLMRNKLLGLGISSNNIQILADGVSSDIPTRHNILHGMRSLVQKANPQDWVIVYWAGHGSVQPGNESNGFDEILLPYDIGQWDEKVGAVKNSILDDEIGIILDKFSNKGVYVWVIFDTCHAGGMNREDALCSPAGCPMERGVEPRQLRIPRERIDAMYRGATDTPPKHPIEPQTKQIHFFAVQPHQTTMEKPIGDGGSYFGVFTYHLANALTHWNGDFRKLEQYIRSKYAPHSPVQPVFQGNISQIPHFPIKK